MVLVRSNVELQYSVHITVIPSSNKNVVKRIAIHGPDDDTLEFFGTDLLHCLENMNERFLEWGWSDGFPLVPPTKNSVEKMLAGTKRAPNDVVVENFVPGIAQATIRNLAKRIEKDDKVLAEL